MLIALIYAIGQTVYFYSRMPPVMASHFGPDGHANGWQSKEAFFGFSCGISAILAFVFMGMPIFIRRLPNRLINLPHKDYWLAPERREASLAYLANQMELIGASALILVSVILHFSITANQSADKTLSPMVVMPMVFIFVIFEFVCIIKMLRHFSIRPT